MPRFLAWVRARSTREIASKLDPGYGARPTFWGRDPARGPTRAPNGADPIQRRGRLARYRSLPRARTSAKAEALRGWGRRSEGSVEGEVGTARLRLAVRVGVPVSVSVGGPVPVPVPVPIAVAVAVPARLRGAVGVSVPVPRRRARGRGSVPVRRRGGVGGPPRPRGLAPVPARAAPPGGRPCGGAL